MELHSADVTKILIGPAEQDTHDEQERALAQLLPDLGPKTRAIAEIIIELGPKYIQAIRGPLPHLKIVPTGGVDVNSAGDFIKAGCVAVAAGSTLVSKDILKNKDWAKLTDLAAQFVSAVAKGRGK